MTQLSQKVRQRPLLMGFIIVVGVLGFAAAWWLGSPLFTNNRINEAFPVTTIQPVDSDTTQAAAAITTPEVINNSPDTVVATLAQPIAVSVGTFRDGDSFHKGMGEAALYQLAEGSFILRFENFDVTNGPDLHVYLAKHPDPTTTEDVNDGGYLDLGSLKGNQGAQNYPIPAGTDIGLYKSVVIYCQPFHVVFSVAPLA